MSWKKAMPLRSNTSSVPRRRAGPGSLLRLVLLILLAQQALALPALAQSYVIRDVTVVDVETGTHRPGQTLIIEDGTIRAMRAEPETCASDDVVTIDGTGQYLIPGLWDMHVHSHRDRRWTYHYPLFRAFGVIGVRDAGSHLGSALAAMERARTDPLAPHVIWGSPIIDGAPPFNSFGLSAEDEASGRILVREIRKWGFDFVKVYDRLTPEAYHGIADEARQLGLRVEGHVPLALSPLGVVASGQTLIDHLTLVLEACTPGALDMVHEAQAKAPGDTDSLELLMDDRFASALDSYDAALCNAQFRQFADRQVWQVPTLIEMKGYFYADDPAVTGDPRADLTSPRLLAEWQEWGNEADPAQLANGRAVLDAQMRMIRPMQDAGVGLLTGTDASSEPWVFAGASVHDELAMFVAAGLSPAEALRTATINPMLYQGRSSEGALIAPGEQADLVLLDGDPLADISNTRRISAVFTQGQYYDRSALDALLDAAREAAAQ
ncbi:MAG: amidohydrolase family protein [Hyphomonas sp.]